MMSLFQGSPGPGGSGARAGSPMSLCGSGRHEARAPAASGSAIFFFFFCRVALFLTFFPRESSSGCGRGQLPAAGLPANQSHACRPRPHTHTLNHAGVGGASCQLTGLSANHLHSQSCLSPEQQVVKQDSNISGNKQTRTE